MKFVNITSMDDPYANIEKDVEARKACLPWLRSREVTLESQRSFIHGLRTNRISDNSYWYIYSHGQAKGLAGFTGINRLSAEFSLLIYPEFEGKGLGTKALKELLNIGFEYMGLLQIHGETYVYDDPFMQIGMEWMHENKPYRINHAWKIFERLGFETEGLLFNRQIKYDKAVHSLMFRMTRDKWNSSKDLSDAS